MPFMGTIGLVFAMASLGLPGLGNFIAEFLTLIGAWQASHKLTVLAAIGLVAGTIYSLRIVQKVFYGKEEENIHVLNDLSLREKLILVPLVIVIIWLGIFPQPVLNAAKPSIDQIQKKQSTTVSLKTQSAIEKKQRGGTDE